MTNLARGILGRGLTPDRQGEDRTWKFVGIWSLNRAEWAQTLLACMHIGATAVGFYDAMGAEQVEFILNQTELSSIVCTQTYAKKVIAMKKNGQAAGIENLVVMGESDGISAELE